MSLLPIVQRELRLRSRKWTTYWLRAGVGILAAAVSALFMIIAWIGQLMGAGGGAKIGQVLFLTLAWMTFVFCLVEGARSTADCLSEEKREGTLGLLFLTDLRGFDVVLGKFVAASLNSFYGLLAIYPVLGVALIIGGVAPAQFWRMTLVLANTLFFATTAGMCVSAFCRRQAPAWAGTLALVFGTTVVPALLALLLPKVATLGQFAPLAPMVNVLTHSTVMGLVESLGRISPAMAFIEALSSGYSRAPTGFGATLLAGHLAGWLMLALASLVLPHAWQDANRDADQRGWLKPRPLNSAAQQKRMEARARTLDRDAVVWLASRDQSSNLVLWLVVALAGAGAALISFSGQMAMGILGWWLMPFRLVFIGWVAARACRFFVEARLSGALELFLTTPLSERDILRGQLLALKDYFLAPLVAFVVVELGFSLLAAFFIPDPTGIMVVGVVSLVGVTWQLADFVGCLFAAIYAGMWLALVLKKPNQAFGLTLLLVLVAPMIIPCVGKFGAYLFLIFFPKHRLETGLRRLITGDTEVRAITLPPPRPAAPPALPPNSTLRPDSVAPPDVRSPN